MLSLDLEYSVINYYRLLGWYSVPWKLDEIGIPGAVANTREQGILIQSLLLLY